MSKPVTSIAPHTRIQGELHFDGPAVVGGHIQGNIAATDSLEIGPEGIIDGNIQGVQVSIQGTVKGNVIASQSCRLGATARVAGDLCTANLAIAEGARFIGQVCVGDDMAPQSAAPVAAPLTDAAEEKEVMHVMEATLHRVEQTVSRMEDPVPAMTTMSVPTMPKVEVLAQNVQAALQRAPRIIRAR